MERILEKNNQGLAIMLEPKKEINSNALSKSTKDEKMRTIEALIDF